MVTNLSYIENIPFDPKKLWEAFLEGDINAYGKIFKFYYRDLYGYGLNISQRPELVKDCIQEVFAKIGKSRSTLAEVESIKAYLLVSLRRMLLRRLKKQRVHNISLNKQEYFNSIQFSPEDILINQEIELEQRKALKKAIEALPDRQKEILILRYFNGMSYEEIEQILSINYQSIRNHIYRATKRLRNVMEKNNSADIPRLPFAHSRVSSI